MSKAISGKQALLLWVQRCTSGYGVIVMNFSTSFADGLAFCAIIHRHRPDVLNFRSLSPDNAAHNHGLAFTVGEKLGIPPLLDVEDMLIAKPEPHSVMTYTAMMYHLFTNGSARAAGIATIKANAELPPPTIGGGGGNGHAASGGHASSSMAGNQQNSKPTWSVLEEACGKCGKPLSGSVAKNKGKSYHASCFTCATCSVVLRGRCMNIDNCVYCEKCGKIALPKAQNSLTVSGGGAATGGGSRRHSFSNVAPEKEAEEKRMRIERQREMIEKEKMRMTQEADERARAEAQREAEKEEKLQKEREEKENAARKERDERMRKEREAREKEAQERLESVRREREELERVAREKERLEEAERQRMIAQQRAKREAEEQERREREEKLQAEKLEKERKQREEEERRLEQEQARRRGAKTPSAAPVKGAAVKGQAGPLKRTVPAKTAPSGAAASSSSAETEGMTEWQRMANEKALKRAKEGTGSASGGASPAQSPSPSISTPPRSPEWQKRAKETQAHFQGGAVASPMAVRRPTLTKDKPPTEWQDKAAHVQAKHAAQETSHVPSKPKVEVAALELPKTAPAEPEKPARSPKQSPLPVRSPKDSPPKQQPSPKQQQPPSPKPEPLTAEHVTAPEYEVMTATPMRPTLPLPVRKSVSTPTTTVAAPEEDSVKSPRSPRYSARPPPAAPATPGSPRSPRMDGGLRKFASFGVTLDSIMQHQTALFPAEKVPRVWTTLVRILHEMDGLKQEGIFRMSGASDDIERLKATLNKGAFDVDFAGDVNTVACALKQWFSDMSEPLIPRAMYEATIGGVEVPGGDAAVLPYIYQSIRDLPDVNRNVLVAFLELMKEVLEHSASNRMTEPNLAICFSPGFFQSQADDPALFIHNTQCETKWVELLLRNPPSKSDLAVSASHARLAAPSRDTLAALSKRKGSFIGSRSSGASNPTLLGQKEVRKSSASPVSPAGSPSTSLGSFDSIFQANNALTSSSDGVESVSTFIVKGDTLQGYLMKENPNGITKMWKRRWFQFQGKRLLYYAEPRPGRPAGEGLKGFVPLMRATVSVVPSYAKREFVLAITTAERTFYLQAADAQDLHYWISSLHDILESPLMNGPESEYTSQASDNALLPGRELSFARDAFAGELERLGPLKIWKKRHIVLSDGILYAFKKNGDRKASEKVFLYGSHLEEYEPSDAECVAFRVRAATGSDIVLRAPSTEIFAGWTNAILRHRLAITDQIESIVLPEK